MVIDKWANNNLDPREHRLFKRCIEEMDRVFTLFCNSTEEERQAAQPVSKTQVLTPQLFLQMFGSN